MKYLRLSGLLVFLLIGFTNCKGQNQANNRNAITPSTIDKNKMVGGGCDGCELMYIGMPTVINSVDTSSGWKEEGQKLLVIGTVYRIDGKTPASEVIIYYWQTNNKGYYSPKEGMDERTKRHGNIRGWVKTDKNGKYSIYTIRPTAYPNENIPAHIHTSIKEPNLKNEYYLDEFVFDDDKLLTGKKRKELENRGGSGILRVLVSGNLQIAEHTIVLGLNIPNYPEKTKSGFQSGLSIGEDSPSFIPYHAWGPDKGTRTCPVCKYGRYHGVIYFVSNNPNWEDIENWLTFLEQKSINQSKYLKVYFVYGNESNYSKEARQKELEQIGQKLNLKHTALTFVPSLNDKESEVNINKINPEVENTFVIYKHRTIIDKFINLKPTTDNFNLISHILENTKNEYFELPEPKHD